MLFGLTKAMIVGSLYVNTQCSDTQFALPTYHTMLPKPNGPQDDVHRAWFSRRLDDLFRQWSKWSFSHYDFLPADSFENFSRFINRNQRAFELKVDEVRDLKPAGGSFDGPDNFVLVTKVAAANPSVCLDMDWPSAGPGKASFRPAGKCRQ